MVPRKDTIEVQLPTEILESIFKSIDREGLKKLRLVCKAFSHAAIPLLFDKIAICPNLVALDVARSVITRFKPHLRTLIYYPISYKSCTRQEYEWQVQVQWRMRQREENRYVEEFPEDLVANIDLWYEAFMKRKCDQETMCSNGELIAHLCSTISQLPMLKCLVIGQIGKWDQMEVENMRYFGVRMGDLCSDEKCRLEYQKHLRFQILPHPGYSPLPQSTIHPVMLALYSSKSSITEIDLENCRCVRDPGTFQSYGAFDLAIPQHRYFAHVLPRLKRLHLDIDIGTWDFDSNDRSCYHECRVAASLSVATNLECLYIRLYDTVDVDDAETTSNFRATLGDCRFPRLKSLILEDFAAEEDEYTQLLTASPKLRHLFMYRCTLQSGTLEHFAHAIGPNLSLTSVMLHCFYNTASLESALGHDYTYYYEQKPLEDFFFRNGKNPFTEDALRATHWRDDDQYPAGSSPMDRLSAHYRWIHQGLKPQKVFD